MPSEVTVGLEPTIYRLEGGGIYPADATVPMKEVPIADNSEPPRGLLQLIMLFRYRLSNQQSHHTAHP